MSERISSNSRPNALLPVFASSPMMRGRLLLSSRSKNEITFGVEDRVANLVVGQTRSVDVRISWTEPEDPNPNKQLVVSTVRFNY